MEVVQVDEFVGQGVEIGLGELGDAGISVVALDVPQDLRFCLTM
jgi:hypothetical protein